MIIAASRRLSYGYQRAEILGALISIIILWVLTTVLVLLAIERIVSGKYDVSCAPDFEPISCFLKDQKSNEMCVLQLCKITHLGMGCSVSMRDGNIENNDRKPIIR